MKTKTLEEWHNEKLKDPEYKKEFKKFSLNQWLWERYIYFRIWLHKIHR